MGRAAAEMRILLVTIGLQHNIIASSFEHHVENIAMTPAVHRK